MSLSLPAPRTEAAFPFIGVPSAITSSFGQSSTSKAIQRNIDEITRPSPAHVGQLQRVRPNLEEQLYDTLAAFKIRTAAIAMHLDREWRMKLFAQFDSLLAAEDWDREDSPPTAGSFSTFLRLITFLNPDRRPGLGATYDGHLIATWTVGTDRLTIECLPADRIRWALSHGVGDDRERAAGMTDVRRIAHVLQPYAPAKWFTNASQAEG